MLLCRITCKRFEQWEKDDVPKHPEVFLYTEKYTEMLLYFRITNASVKQQDSYNYVLLETAHRVTFINREKISNLT